MISPKSSSFSLYLNVSFFSRSFLFQLMPNIILNCIGKWHGKIADWLFELSKRPQIVTDLQIKAWSLWRVERGVEPPKIVFSFQHFSYNISFFLKKKWVLRIKRRWWKFDFAILIQNLMVWGQKECMPYFVIIFVFVAAFFNQFFLIVKFFSINRPKTRKWS